MQRNWACGVSTEKVRPIVYSHPAVTSSGLFARCFIQTFMALFFAVSAGPSPAQEAPNWSDVGALFAKRCVMCHSGKHAALELRLDSYEGAMAGSKNGAVLAPGDVSTGELIRRVRGESQPRMPFLSYPLSSDEIIILEHWIEAGLPEGVRTEAAAKDHGRP